MGFLYLSQWFPLAFDGSEAGRIYFSAVNNCHYIIFVRILLVCLVIKLSQKFVVRNAYR